jgi:arsenate reductase
MGQAGTGNHREGVSQGHYVAGMADVTIFHNPDCSTSRYAVETAAELGVAADVVVYRTTPPDADTLREIIAKLDDRPTDLVRRDALFEKLGLSDADVATVEQVVDTLVEHKMLLQRPLIVTPERAFIGRPKTRVREAFAS